MSLLNEGVADRSAALEVFTYLDNFCDKAPGFAEMKLISQSHINQPEGGYAYTGNKCTDDPIQAYAFMDPKDQRGG